MWAGQTVRGSPDAILPPTPSLAHPVERNVHGDSGPNLPTDPLGSNVEGPGASHRAWLKPLEV